MFKPGHVWNDTGGRPIQAHGGGVLYDNGTYYWFGENKDAPNTYGARVDVVGVSCYSSQNLLHWKNEGVVLPAVPDDPSHDLHPSRVAERPKVIYNARTKQYVLWLHIDSPDYTYARTGRAVSDSPTGPYRYLGSIAPTGADSRDMTVFQDTDGAAYLFFSSDWNKTIKIARLTDDYLDTTDTVAEAFVGQSREAPAVWTHSRPLLLRRVGLHRLGGERGAVRRRPVAARPVGGQGKPVRRAGGRNHLRRPEHVRPARGRESPARSSSWPTAGTPDNLQDSRYVWLPLEVEGNRVTVRWRDEWDLSGFDAGGSRG